MYGDTSICQGYERNEGCDLTVNIIFILLAVLGTAVIVRSVLSRMRAKKKPDRYVCNVCGEHDCDCHRE